MNPFEIALDTIGPDGFAATFSLDPESVTREFLARGADDIHPVGSLEVSLRLSKEGDEVGLAGEVSGRVVRTCVKCLESFPFDIATSFSLKLVRGGARSGMEGHGELELKASDLDVETFDGEHVDIAAVVYEQLILSLTAYPVCRTDCKGLCPECGAELNREGCRCGKEKPIDPRLAALARFRKPAG